MVGSCVVPRMVGGDLRIEGWKLRMRMVRKGAATAVSVGRARGRSEWKWKLASQAERKKSTKKW
jgi:hypothetical protein